MKINYPNPSLNNLKPKKIKSYGMLFEEALNISNEYYRNQDIAHIYKKPTPIQVVKVDYPSRNKAKIVEAYYKTPSTTDYNGIYKGKYIDYEAKETNNLSFSFTHIANHQLLHLQNIDKHGGIAFIIIYYRKVEKVIIIDIKIFMELYKLGLENKEKSIKVAKALEIGVEVKLKYSPPIDYLKALDILYQI
ncbi:MAG TPA: Holliday junction resolvase RecU [Acholeplasmataceae bacterium]|nr:Holliday junction resolvase RecU [Acholeplasmataceae bacterium]